MEYAYRGKFRVVDGDFYDPSLADLKGLAFIEKARQYETKIDALFRDSPVIKDVYLNSEIITFEGYELSLTIFTNLNQISGTLRAIQRPQYLVMI